MNHRVAFFVACAVLLPGVIRADIPGAPAPGEPREAQFATPVEKTLENGLRVIVVARPGLPVLSADLLIKSGAEVDPPELAGLASLTATLLTRGTAQRSATKIAEDIEALGAQIDATADWDATTVGLSALSSQAPAALEILADVVRNPAFAKDEIERARRETLDALRVAYEEPRTIALAAAQRAIFGTGAYAHMRSGTLASIARAQRESIVQLHALHYRPGNAVLVFAGDLTAEQGFAWAQKYFGDWQNPSVSPPERPTDETPPKPRIVVIDMPNAGQAAVVVARPGITRAAPDYISGLVANSVLGNGYTSRLNVEIRIKRGLTYGAKSSLRALARTGPFLAYAQTKNPAAVEVAGLVREQLDLLGSQPVAPSELTPRISSLTGDYSRDLETNDGFAKAIGTLAVHDRPFAELNSFLRDARAVGPDAIQQFVHEHLGSAGTTLVIAGKLKDFRKALGTAYKNAEIIPQSELDLDAPSLRGKR